MLVVLSCPTTWSQCSVRYLWLYLIPHWLRKSYCLAKDSTTLRWNSQDSAKFKFCKRNFLLMLKKFDSYCDFITGIVTFVVTGEESIHPVLTGCAAVVQTGSLWFWFESACIRSEVCRQKEKSQPNHAWRRGNFAEKRTIINVRTLKSKEYVILIRRLTLKKFNLWVLKLLILKS